MSIYRLYTVLRSMSVLNVPMTKWQPSLSFDPALGWGLHSGLP